MIFAVSNSCVVEEFVYLSARKLFKKKVKSLYLTSVVPPVTILVLMEADGAPSTPLLLSVLRFTGIQSYGYKDQRKVETDKPFEDQDIPVARDAEKVTVLYLRDVPYEAASDDVIDFLSAYGEVLTVECSVAADFPNLCDGTEFCQDGP